MSTMLSAADLFDWNNGWYFVLHVLMSCMGWEWGIRISWIPPPLRTWFSCWVWFCTVLCFAFLTSHQKTSKGIQMNVLIFFFKSLFPPFLHQIYRVVQGWLMSEPSWGHRILFSESNLLPVSFLVPLSACGTCLR